MPPRVDYDRIAHLYDEPLRDHTLDAELVHFLAERRSQPRPEIRILDMGCGTGKQLSEDRGALPEPAMVGLDLSRGMLRQARGRCALVAWVQGDSGAPPFAAARFDYITNQFSYAHVRHKRQMIRETYRLLKPGGRFVMTNIDPWSMPGWIVYRYFPAARERDGADFLPAEEFAALMEAAGFTAIQIRREDRSRQENLAQFLEYASQRFRASQLMAITDADYAAGLARLAEDVARAGKEAVVASEVCLVTVVGDKR